MRRRFHTSEPLTNPLPPLPSGSTIAGMQRRTAEGGPPVDPVRRALRRALRAGQWQCARILRVLVFTIHPLPHIESLPSARKRDANSKYSSLKRGPRTRLELLRPLGEVAVYQMDTDGRPIDDEEAPPAALLPLWHARNTKRLTVIYCKDSFSNILRLEVCRSIP